MNGETKDHHIDENIRDFWANDNGSQSLAVSSRREFGVPCCNHRNTLECEDEGADEHPDPAQGIHI